MYNKKNYHIAFFIMCIALFLIVVFSSCVGTAHIKFNESLNIILSKIPIINKLVDINNISSTHKLIILNIRLPRIFLSLLTGAGLSLVGAVFQAIFKNPMADPYILGISSGSALGASFAIVLNVTFLFFNISGITILAFIGAILTTFLVYKIAKVGNKPPTNTLLLAGVSVSFLLSSINSLVMIFNKDRLEEIIFWTMGSMSAATWQQVTSLFLFILLGSVIILIYGRDLNVMLMGDDCACSLGIEVENLKTILLITSSLIIASCVSVSGVIGFVGLIIPHIVRIILGPDHKKLLPFCLVAGAIFMIISDTLARTLIPPAEIPVGAITSIFGAPYFIHLLIKNKKKVF